MLFYLKKIHKNKVFFEKLDDPAIVKMSTRSFSTNGETIENRKNEKKEKEIEKKDREVEKKEKEVEKKEKPESIQQIIKLKKELKNIEDKFNIKI